MTTNKMKVLVVDDSAVMRQALKRVLEQDQRITVIGNARNGQEAIEMVKKYSPDIVTMDIEMPVMDGLTALRHIMTECPTPVIMISSLTTEGAQATFKALELGAVDYVAKGGDSFQSLKSQIGGFVLRQKVRAICMKKNNFYAGISNKLSISKPTFISGNGFKKHDQTESIKLSEKKIVAIGTSTGGPIALQKIIADLPRELSVPVLVVQHMPTAFIEPFAERLNNLSQVSVKQSENNEKLEAGTVYIGHGGVHLKIKRNSSAQIHILHDNDDGNSAFVPSVDAMMLSVASECGRDTLGVIMTGMGNDGLKGMTQIKDAGGATIAQDEHSCVVYGMPKVCVEAHIIDKIVPLARIGKEIIDAISGSSCHT